jgi:hypothetical protein
VGTLSVIRSFVISQSQHAPSRAALHNGKCDVVIVPLARNYIAADNAAMASILAELSDVNYVAGVVSQSSQVVPGHKDRMLLNGSKNYVYMSPDIMAGLLIALLMIVTVLVGVNCLTSVQTPTAFCHEALPPGKEF